MNLSRLAKIVCFLGATLLTQCTTHVEENTSAIWTYTFPTMGTMGHISIVVDSNIDIDTVAIIDAIQAELQAVNQSVNTWDPNSYLSRYNTGDTSLNPFKDKEYVLIDNILASKRFHKLSFGAFNPAVMALVSFYEERDVHKLLSKEEQFIVDSIVQVIANFPSIFENQGDVFLPLDFSAIAKGYGIDAIAKALNNLGIENYLIEIGGEVVAKGYNARNTQWVLGVETPNTSLATDIYAKVSLSNFAMATSGNYHNYREGDDGSKWVHIIDPRDGKNKQTDILSATIVAKDCMSADAMATASMVLGKQQSLEMVEQIPNTEILLILSAPNGQYQTVMSSGFNAFLAY